MQLSTNNWDQLHKNVFDPRLPSGQQFSCQLPLPIIIIIIIIVAQLARAITLLHHVHGQQQASRGLQWDGWNHFVAGRATCSVDEQVGDATCGQEVSWAIRWCGAKQPCLPVWRRQVEPHAQIPRCVNGIGDGTVKSDRSVVVLHYFGLGRTIRFQAALSDTSGGKHPESSHQLMVSLPIHSKYWSPCNNRAFSSFCSRWSPLSLQWLLERVMTNRKHEMTAKSSAIQPGTCHRSEHKSHERFLEYVAPSVVLLHQWLLSVCWKHATMVQHQSTVP